MVDETHKTAVVVIPPDEVWAPIQTLRAAHDRRVRRWMPHITLLYPFRPVAEFCAVKDALVAACDAQLDFDVALAEFGTFHHPHDQYTVWLKPEPPEPFVDLHAALWTHVGPGGGDPPARPHFQPHLSVGQIEGKMAMQRLVSELQAAWKPVRFCVAAVSVICRQAPPDDVFRVAFTVPLAARPIAA
jgi:2'-5' RNA ligase